MLDHIAPDDRCHWYVNPDGEPDHVPFVPDTTVPGWRPVAGAMTGAAVLVGAEVRGPCSSSVRLTGSLEQVVRAANTPRDRDELRTGDVRDLPPVDLENQRPRVVVDNICGRSRRGSW